MTLKTFDPNLRKISNNSIAEKTGVDAFILMLQDVIETEIAECPEDINRGTNISTDYLNGSVNMLNSMILENIVYLAIKNNIPEIEISEDQIEIVADYDNEEYLFYISVSSENQTEEDQVLSFSLNIKR